MNLYANGRSPSFLAVREEKLTRLFERHAWNVLHLEAYSLFRDFVDTVEEVALDNKFFRMAMRQKFLFR